MPEPMLRYLALGDSVATGAVTHFMFTVPYPVLLRDSLARQLGRPVLLVSRTRNGLTTRGMLRLLRRCPALQREVRRAGLITLSIGGNDLMKAAAVPGFSRISAPAAQCGQQEFLSCWPRLTALLRQLNPDAALEVMTIYNPYCLAPCPPCDSGLHRRTEAWLEPMNRQILLSGAAGCTVADVHGAFLSFSTGQMGRVVAMYPAGLLRNPHPTPCGQRLIAQCHLRALDPAALAGQGK